LLDKNITDFFKNIIIPPVCCVCGRISPDYLCSQCASEILPLSNVRCCKYCGRPFPDSGNGMKSNLDSCSLCRDEGYNFTAHRSFSLYRGNMKKIIVKFKYGKIYNLKNILADFLYRVYSDYFSMEDIDYVDTVPGEHTVLLTKYFAMKYGIPFIQNILRIKKTERQGKLGMDERMVNILNCFKLRDCLAYRNKNILLIDDVWTTGSTLKEISRIISRAGSKKIFLLTLARGHNG
jgi:competence protein ComFC